MKKIWPVYSISMAKIRGILPIIALNLTGYDLNYRVLDPTVKREVKGF